MPSLFTRTSLVLSGLVVVVLLLIGTYATRQPVPSALPLEFTFDRSTESWVAFGDGAQVRITTASQHVKSGGAALELEYEVGPSRLGSAVLPVSVGALASMREMRFWIKSDLDTTVAVVLSETSPGGYYSAWFSLPRDQWRHVVLFPQDFSLNEGPDEPADPNARLDLDQVQAVGLIDLGQFFGEISRDPRYPIVLSRPTGTHYLHVDDMHVVATGGAEDGRRNLIGDPARGLVSWMALGGAALDIATEQNPLDVPAFRATYARNPGQYVLLAHGLSALDLDGAATLRFSAASALPASFVVYLEERNPGHAYGPRYSSTLTMQGGSVAHQRVLRLSEFTYDATSPDDPDGRLDLQRLRSIALLDVTAVEQTEQNTIWLSQIEASSR